MFRVASVVSIRLDFDTGLDTLRYSTQIATQSKSCLLNPSLTDAVAVSSSQGLLLPPLPKTLGLFLKIT